MENGKCFSAGPHQRSLTDRSKFITDLIILFRIIFHSHLSPFVIDLESQARAGNVK
jgi:hypothetical protein